jgi:hypothetical protein
LVHLESSSFVHGSTRGSPLPILFTSKVAVDYRATPRVKQADLGFGDKSALRFLPLLAQYV